MITAEDALRTLARHDAELSFRRSENAARQAEAMKHAEAAYKKSDADIARGEVDQKTLQAKVRNLAQATGTTESIVPSHVPTEAEVRAELERLTATWPTFQLLSGAERLANEERHRLASGRTIQWIWLVLAVAGPIALVALQLIIMN